MFPSLFLILGIQSPFQVFPYASKIYTIDNVNCQKNLIFHLKFDFFDVIFSISFLGKTQADCDQVRGRKYLMLKRMGEVLKNLKY